MHARTRCHPPRTRTRRSVAQSTTYSPLTTPRLVLGLLDRTTHVGHPSPEFTHAAPMWTPTAHCSKPTPPAYPHTHIMHCMHNARSTLCKEYVRQRCLVPPVYLLTLLQSMHACIQVFAYDNGPAPSRGRVARIASISIGGGGVSNFTTALAYLEAAGREGVDLAVLPEEFRGSPGGCKFGGTCWDAETIDGPTITTIAGKANSRCGPLRPHTTPFPEENPILGVIYGVLLVADTNAATPLGAWGCSVMSLEPVRRLFCFLFCRVRYLYGMVW